MFTSTFVEENQRNLVKSNMGVNLKLVKSHKLYPDQLYSSYSEEQLHYVIQAVQKGRRPHTQIGLKRLMKRNAAKELKKKKEQKQITELNPKSPEEICMKAIRTQFRYKISKKHMQAQPQIKIKTQVMIKRKENQRKRRIQLIKLTRKYRYELLPHFGDRLYGRGRCPKVSRQEIKDYLKTLGIEANTEWEVFVYQQENIEEKTNVPLFRDEDFPSLLA